MLNKLLNLFGYSRDNRNIEDVYVQSRLHILKTCGSKKDIVELLKKNHLLIKKVRIELPFSKKEFESFVDPIIHYIASYYLYLPSSKDHHHRDAGGAFTHALESAIATLLLIKLESNIFKNIKSEYRYKYKIASSLTVFIMALVHDTGKPIADFDVHACDHEGTINNKIIKWEPTKENISKWVDTNKVKYYRPFFHTSRRHKKHEFYSGIAMGRIDVLINKFADNVIVKEQINEMLVRADVEITREMLMIVIAGDRNSTRYYMENMGRTPRDNGITDSFFEALQTFYWDMDNNVDGFKSKPFFWTQSGLHIHYPKGLNAIAEIMADLGLKLPTKNSEPAVVLANVLFNASHLLIIDNNNNTNPGIHKLHVQDNTDDDATNKWHTINVVSIKQPHLLKLIAPTKVYKCSYESHENEDDMEIPLQARAINEVNGEFYKELLTVEPGVEITNINNASAETPKENDVKAPNKPSTKTAVKPNAKATNKPSAKTNPKTVRIKTPTEKMVDEKEEIQDKFVSAQSKVKLAALDKLNVITNQKSIETNKPITKKTNTKEKQTAKKTNAMATGVQNSNQKDTLKKVKEENQDKKETSKHIKEKIEQLVSRNLDDDHPQKKNVIKVFNRIRSLMLQNLLVFKKGSLTSDRLLEFDIKENQLIMSEDVFYKKSISMPDSVNFVQYLKGPNYPVEIFIESNAEFIFNKEITKLILSGVNI